MSASSTGGNPTFKAVGISLAVGSGYKSLMVALLMVTDCLSGHHSCCMFLNLIRLGTNANRKKKGLLQANKKYETNPGEGTYLPFGNTDS